MKQDLSNCPGVSTCGHIKNAVIDIFRGSYQGFRRNTKVFYLAEKDAKSLAGLEDAAEEDELAIDTLDAEEGAI